MTDYILVPVDLLSELAESLACELDARYPETIRSYEWKDREYQAEMEPVLTARRIIAAAPDHIADTRKMVASAVQGEPIGFCEDTALSLAERTFSSEVDEHLAEDVIRYARRLHTLYTAPQPAEQQQPASWIRIRGDHVILSRCDWMYPASTEDSAGPRDEQRFAAVGRRDGDIVLPAPEGALDREDMKTMLTWPNASKPAEQQPAPDVTALVELLAEARDHVVSSTQPVRGGFIDEIDTALAAHRKGGEK